MGKKAKHKKRLPKDDSLKEIQKIYYIVMIAYYIIKIIQEIS